MFFVPLTKRIHDLNKKKKFLSLVPTITSSILLAIDIQHHGISSSTPPLALLVSCTHCTLRELLSPPFGRVASLQLSLVLSCVASLRSYSSLLPRVGHLPRASSLVNGSVAVSGNGRSSGPCGPSAWYCTISWHHHSVQSARRKVVTSFRSSLPRTSRVVSLMSRVSFRWLGYSQPLPAIWPRPTAPAFPPLLSFGLVDSLVSFRHMFYLSPAPWSFVAPYASFRVSGVDPDLRSYRFWYCGFSHCRLYFGVFGRGFLLLV